MIIMKIKVGSFLGTGWSFPVYFDKTHAWVQMASDAEDIAQSIRIILGTTPGERLMQPEFGCDLKSLLFETADDSLVARLNHLIYHALLNFEPRINFLEAEILCTRRSISAGGREGHSCLDFDDLIEGPFNLTAESMPVRMV